MSHFFSLDTLIEVLLGISLSVAAGFRVFVPLLVLSGASVMAHLNLPTDFDWLETPQALVVFAIACTLEIMGYYVSWLDHLLDIVSTPAAIIAGTVVAASLTPDINPIAQWTLALIAGGGAAGLTKGVMNLFRLTSTAASGGLTNPILATIELVLAVTLSVLAVTVPLVAGALLLILLIVGTQRLWVFLSSLRSPQIPDPNES